LEFTHAHCAHHCQSILFRSKCRWQPQSLYYGNGPLGRDWFELQPVIGPSSHNANMAWTDYRGRFRNDLQTVRLVFYIVLLIFSIILMGLTAGRISYTEHLSNGDPLNRGVNFYDPSVVELLVCSLLLIGISAFFIWTILELRETRHTTRLWFECAVLGVMWLLLLVGTAVATSIWPNLNFCISSHACQLLQAMLAFAWLSWLVLTFLLVVSLVYAIRSRRWNGHVHSWGGWNTKPVVATSA